jgi:hypothetical protein
MNAHGSVYFIENRKGDLVKIGHSRNVPIRLREIGRGCKLLGSIPGGMSLESEIHNRFHEYQFRNEWFKKTPELSRFIISLKM